jgi:hypothetical protein
LHARQSHGGSGAGRFGLGWPMGFGGPGWAGAGAGRAFGLGPNRKDKILSFFEIFSSAKTNSEIPENASKARKILQKSQKFHENS